MHSYCRNWFYQAAGIWVLLRLVDIVTHSGSHVTRLLILGDAAISRID